MSTGFSVLRDMFNKINEFPMADPDNFFPLTACDTDNVPSPKALSPASCATSCSRNDILISASEQTDNKIINSVQAITVASSPRSQSYTHAPFVTLRKRKGPPISTSGRINSADPPMKSVNSKPSEPINVTNSNNGSADNEFVLLQAITPPKTIFISRLVKSVTSNDVLLTSFLSVIQFLILILII